MRRAAVLSRAFLAAVVLATTAEAGPPQGISRLSARAPATAQTPAPERIPIDLGPDAPTGGPPEQIDILSPPPASEAASAAMRKECEERREAGIVAGEIVVCRELEVSTDQLYSGSREAWLKAFAERTQNVRTIAPPDVSGPGIFRGPAIISGLCVIPPCPKDAALIIDVEAIEKPPEGSDAARVAQGLTPVESDDAPLSDQERRRVEAQLGLPEAPEG